MIIRIQNAEIVNEGKRFTGSVTIADNIIRDIIPADDSLHQLPHADQVVEADGMILMPGMIDEHVHFREPGLTHKADIVSESRAAAAGGVTTIFDMPNVIPPTVTHEALSEKFAMMNGRCVVNYSLYFGATQSNVELLPQLDTNSVCGVKLFMGSTTGNMLVEDEETLRAVFTRSPLLIVAHCEDSSIIASNLATYRKCYGNDPDVSLHPKIRSTEACLRSTTLAIKLAKSAGARLHIAHISTAEELKLFNTQPLCKDKRITAEACIPHLTYTDKDYSRLGALIKCNPAIKSDKDRKEIRCALNDNRIDTVATDHAPHLLSEKVGGCVRAASGIPMVQFVIPCMFELYEEGIISLERIVKLLCHNPATLFQITRRGYIREGFYADLTLLKREQWILKKQDILSKCAWSPLEGETFAWQVKQTFCNGRQVFKRGDINAFRPCGERICFNR